MDVIHFGELLCQLTTVLRGQNIFMIFSLSRAHSIDLLSIHICDPFCKNLPKCAEYFFTLRTVFVGNIDFFTFGFFADK